MINRLVYGIGFTILSAYVALATPACRENKAEDNSDRQVSASQQLPILEARLKEATTSIKDGKDTVEATLTFSNGGQTDLPPLSWSYSLCCAPPGDPNNTDYCVGGGSGQQIDALAPGKSVDRTVSAKPFMAQRFECRDTRKRVFHVGVDSLKYDAGYFLE